MSRAEYMRNYRASKRMEDPIEDEHASCAARIASLEEEIRQLKKLLAGRDVSVPVETSAVSFGHEFGSSRPAPKPISRR